MSHQHEAWQLLDSAKGGQYCGACGDHITTTEEQPPAQEQSRQDPAN